MNLKVRGEYITLGQLLKVAGLAGTGGEAKFLLSEGGVTVNGEAEDRRGRKLRPGDTVRLPDGQNIRLE
jgi:ribosome-associated protein